MPLPKIQMAFFTLNLKYYLRVKDSREKQGRVTFDRLKQIPFTPTVSFYTEPTVSNEWISVTPIKRNTKNRSVILSWQIFPPQSNLYLTLCHVYIYIYPKGPVFTYVQISHFIFSTLKSILLLTTCIRNANMYNNGKMRYFLSNNYLTLTCIFIVVIDFLISLFS